MIDSLSLSEERLDLQLGQIFVVNEVIEYHLGHNDEAKILDFVGALVSSGDQKPGAK